MYSYLRRHRITFLILLLLKVGTSVHIYLPLTTKVLLAIITSHEGYQYKLIQPIVYTAFFFPFRQIYTISDAWGVEKLLVRGLGFQDIIHKPYKLVSYVNETNDYYLDPKYDFLKRMLQENKSFFT